MAHSKHLTTEEPLPWLDQFGLAALLAGSLLVLITFFTSYSHLDIPSPENIALNQQIGIPLLLAALAAFVGEVKLASNARCADQRDRIEARIRAAEARNHSVVGEVGRRPKNESEQLKHETAQLLTKSSGGKRLRMHGSPRSNPSSTRCCSVPIPPHRFPPKPTAIERNPRPAAGGSGLLGLPLIWHQRQRSAAGIAPQRTWPLYCMLHDSRWP